MDFFTVFLFLALQTFIAAGNPTYRNSKSSLTGIESNPSTAFRIIGTDVQNIPNDLKQLHKNAIKTLKPLDCSDIYLNGERSDGLYDIWPQSRMTKGPLRVYCDMESNGGGWTVIQRRKDYGRRDDFFFNDWNVYKRGFGCLLEDFWIGNDNLFALTNQRLYELRVNLTSWERETAYATYDEFWITDEDCNYALHVKGYDGTAGDSLHIHSGSSFSTKDRDNTKNGTSCAKKNNGAWWYGSDTCMDSNLNGLYLKGYNSDYEGIIWKTFKGYKHSLRDTVMKIRPFDFGSVYLRKLE